MDQRTIAILEKQRQDLVVRVLKKHEEAEAGRLLTERILAGISEFFLLFDQDFNLLQANRSFSLAQDRLPVMVPGQEAAGLRLEHLFSEEEGQRIAALLVAEDSRETETQLLLAEGPVPVRLRPQVHVTPGGRVLYILLCTDLSELYQLMERIREGQKQLMHSSRLASLGEMTAGIGHELTQPLNTILLLARNALKVLDAPQGHAALVRENLELIVDRAERAGTIINTMRSFGRRVEGVLTTVDINALLRKIVHFLAGQLRIHEVEVELELAAQALPVWAIEVRLEQVFLNLVQNAIQAMGEKERPRLYLGTRLRERLDVQSMRYQTCVVTEVRDNGAGMSEELQGKIFDPFFTTKENGGGMGLGLALVDRIVREFAGFVDVVSHPGEGSCFSIWLPLSTEEEHLQENMP
ncbi:MAG: ATP-binding protein [bacterium]|nr:ATP-binding protein [bacterium]